MPSCGVNKAPHFWLSVFLQQRLTEANELIACIS